MKLKNIEIDGTLKVARYLSAKGHSVKIMPARNPQFDLLLNGKIKTEVKTALPQKNNGNRNLRWAFNIHRHNRINESNVDIYILRFEGIGFSKYAVHALYKAPLKKPTLSFTERSMLSGQIADGVRAFQNFVQKKTFDMPIT